MMGIFGPVQLAATTVRTEHQKPRDIKRSICAWLHPRWVEYCATPTLITGQKKS